MDTTTIITIAAVLIALACSIIFYAIGKMKGYEEYDIDVETIHKEERAKILKEESDAKTKLKYLRADQALAIMKSVVVIPPTQEEMIKNKLYNSLI